jgi:hypothetical protein
MSDRTDELVAAVRDASRALDDAHASLKHSALGSVQLAMGLAESALRLLTRLDADKPVNPFPIDPFDDPVTVEAVEVARVRDAARVIALRHAVTELKKVLDD